MPRIKEEGRIINLSSFVTRAASPSVFAYSMSKSTINTLTLMLAKQLGSRQITVNAILPGIINTDMNAGTLQSPDGQKYAASLSTFNRWGEPQDVATRLDSRKAGCWMLDAGCGLNKTAASLVKGSRCFSIRISCYLLHYGFQNVIDHLTVGNRSGVQPARAIIKYVHMPVLYSRHLRPDWILFHFISVYAFSLYNKQMISI